MSSYRKSMSEVYNNMYLSEDNVAVLRNIVKNKQMQPIKFSDGKMGVDLFTASAVTQALDKVNDKNREKLTKLINTGKKSAFASIAKVVMKSENYPEIEEAVSMAQQAAIAISKKERGNKPKKEEADDFKTHMMYDPKTGKGYKADTMDDHLRMKKMGYTHDAPKKEEVDLDEGFKTGDKVKIDTEFEGETHNGQSGVIHKVGTGRNKGAYTVKFSDGKVQSYDDEELIKEEVDLDEGTWALPKTPKEMAALKKLLSKPLKAKDASDKLYDIIGDDEMSDDLDDYADKNPNDDIRPMVKSHMKRLGIKEEVKALTPTGEYSRYREEVELDESVIDKVKEIASKKSAAKIDGTMVDSFTASAISQIYDKVNDANKKKMEKLPIIKLATLAMKMMQKNEYVPEDVELDEAAPMTTSKQDATTKRIKKRMKDKKEEDELDEYGGNFGGGPMRVSYGKKKKDKKEEVDEAKEKSGRQLVDPNKEVMVVKKNKVIVIDKKDQDKYIKQGYSLAEASARADAMKAMRKGKSVDPADVDNTATDDDVKAASKNIIMQLRKAVSLRSYEVEFADGKHKVNSKIAQAVQNKYNTMRRPADKEKYQMQIAKSYKDMMRSLKAGYGEQKETILSRIGNKLKERKNG